MVVSRAACMAAVLACSLGHALAFGPCASPPSGMGRLAMSPRGARVAASSAACVSMAAGGDMGGTGMDRRLLLRSGLAAAAWTAGAGLWVPEGALAKRKEKKEEEEAGAADQPTISLKEFYKALYDERVQNVEFDGSMYERCYVQLDGKKEFVLIGEGYPRESAVSSSGPQQVLAKIKNEIKAGNPVTWSWRFANRFKKKPAEATAEEDEEEAAPAPQAKEAPKKEKTKEEKKEEREARREEQEKQMKEAKAEQARKNREKKEKAKKEKERKEREKNAPRELSAEEKALQELEAEEGGKAE
eukprot:CAMPEP_0173426338 /NCGR_PEP_ID=MMETSP1357-20121228/5827_1 /TAXON_ID=77926 /ORGANISM="Hemiselmis rufescens, Strain PCC563" /LENGTH=300 /DNA_ID=CAMNT_0014389977 /DNA_START=23 /DNA_END=925 /DNA_ORIENTATION=-